MEERKNNRAMERSTLDDSIYISVIVPVYNAAASLHKCIDSILEQTYTEFELLLINDGSADHSLEIMNSFTEKDARVKVIDKVKNSGVSDTRNIGVSYAKGKNICFIDSDDWVEKNYLQVFIDNYESSETLLLQNLIRGKPRELYYKTYPLQTDFSELFVKNNLLYYGAPYVKFFDREIIIKNKILFNKEISYGEDLMFFLEYIKQIKAIKIIDAALYHYEYTENSLSRVQHSFNTLFILHSAIKDFISFQKQKEKEVKKYLYRVDWDIAEASIDQGIIGKKLNREEAHKSLHKISSSLDSNHFLYSSYYRKVLFLLLKTRQFGLLLKLKRNLNK
ncbi:glycosyltransferase family 2 protein [Chryseobacterium limigenitum]|uniref:Glycosyltransferase involved in cell wall bisynthesis n=1 Tax=Chryseobacterium limigenitum TaxID=1612149 RepID=A0A1K2IFE1_9FLAO|nr:glycosyltransferase family 2 protein [Chryseobacterium limigenitum]SFZ91141.1 Glycosyltransferase involved in cell wall bisynthesis [Chryseobacterium limigenitum]